MNKTVFLLLIAFLALIVYPSHAQTEIRPDVTIVLSFSGSDRYPGGTIKFNIVMIDSGTTPDLIDNITLTTPWQIYSKLNILETLSPGDAYVGGFNITIPANQPTGDIKMIVKSSSRYLIGQSWAKFNDVNSTYTLNILPNPYDLQDKLKANQSKVSSLEDQVASLLRDNQNKTAQIQKLGAELSQVKASLSNANSQLANMQSQLNAYYIYLPLGVAVPSVIAIILAILLLRSRSEKQK